MNKIIQQIEPAGYPPALDHCLEVLHRTDAVAPFAVFGGAPRDADYAAYHETESRLNDYDVRVWLPGDDHEERARQFVSRLGIAANTFIERVPSAGTFIVRYCLSYKGADMDVSIRTQPPCSPHVIESPAVERVTSSLIGISSIAIAPDRTVWATPEYLRDRNERTLTVYEDISTASDRDAKKWGEYVERMQQKFPEHTVVQYEGNA
ncbi:MAG: hypothetical protein ABWX94_02465 [Candidatus Saccharimonadales bacterium]